MGGDGGRGAGRSGLHGWVVLAEGGITAGEGREVTFALSDVYGQASGTVNLCVSH